MAFQTGNRTIWCRAFSLSLEGEALEWFNSLPQNSIESFDGLKAMFGRQFANYRSQDLTIFQLSSLRQGKEETLKAFMDLYQKKVWRVKGLNSELARQYVLPTLKPGSSKESVCRHAPKTLEELRERAVDEIRVEEMKKSYRNKAQEAKEKSEGKSHEGPSGASDRRIPSGARVSSNTPR
ncbi:uncharacterized protein LOC108344395 [Vigna angularis]|uniref:uncharacterized protein LOC108344395 n=1 Tax=Phaseolus angularis TaxID=3914 RepID=UPI00080A6EC6|nr:uncharacterized protein LOC108344395 [Vigna angularis]